MAPLTFERRWKQLQRQQQLAHIPSLFFSVFVPLPYTVVHYIVRYSVKILGIRKRKRASSTSTSAAAAIEQIRDTNTHFLERKWR